MTPGLSPSLHTYKDTDIDDMLSIIPTAHLKLYTSRALDVLKGVHFELVLGVELRMKTTIYSSLLVKQTYATNLLYATDPCTTDMKLYYMSKFNYQFNIKIFWHCDKILLYDTLFIELF